MTSRFDTYSTADIMYDPVPNLRNCCKYGDDVHGEEEIMTMQKDSKVEYECLLAATAMTTSKEQIEITIGPYENIEQKMFLQKI